MKTRRQIHLIDILADAEIEAPVGDYVGVQPVMIKRELRMSLFQHPNSRVSFDLTLESRPRLLLGAGIKQSCWQFISSPVNFAITVVDGTGSKYDLFEQTLEPSADAGHRQWFNIDLDLLQFANQRVRLQLSTQVPEGFSNEYCWSAWSDPVVEWDSTLQASPGPIRPETRQRHVVFITADSLRADHLGCYGNPTVKTPHLDQLAAEGVLFTHARAQTSTSLGAYACISTGTHVPTHGLRAEWGTIAANVVSLPELLKNYGWHTLFAGAEGEMMLGDGSLESRFVEVIPCLARPFQSGDVTVRQFKRRLRQRPPKNLFAWVQLFECHPPESAPEPYRSMYYAGDPADSLREYDRDKLKTIRGVETALHMQSILEGLEHGEIDIDLAERLRATARALCGRCNYGPDLMEILPHLPAAARRGLAPPEFGQWLQGEVDKLDCAEISPDLLEWLHTLYPYLRTVENEIISWVDGAVDFRYALAQYMGEVSYVDHHVGQIVAALKEEGIYDDTTLVFMAPHGEVLDEMGYCFHHQIMSESVLRIPVIVKAPGDLNLQGNRRVAGVFDQIDLMPTILQSLELPVPASCQGLSRWTNVLSGTAIEEHDSISVDCHGVVITLARPPYLYLRGMKRKLPSLGWSWKPGQERLHLLRTPMNYDEDLMHSHAGVAARMSASLNEWLKLMKIDTPPAHNQPRTLSGSH